MKTMKLRICVAILLLVTVASQLYAAVAIGSIVAVKGYAHATSAEGKFRRLQLKSPVYLNDTIATGDGARVQIMFNDNSIISQGEKGEITIDKYVYSPKNKKDVKCSMKIARGIVRVLTGKITDLNPERFKVQTRRASIGIRGCHVGFNVQDDREDVYVLWLPEGRTIAVQRLRQPDHLQQDGWDAHSDILNITDSGIAVTLDNTSAFEARPVAAAEARQLFLDSSSVHSGGSSTTPDAEESGALGDVTDSVNAILDEGSAVESEGSSDGEEDPDAVLIAGLTHNPQLLLPAPPESRPDIENAPVEVVVGPFVPPPPPSAPPPVLDPIPPPTPPPPSILTQDGGVGHEWVWGIYDDGSMDYGPMGFPMQNGEYLQDADFQAIVDDVGFTHTLTGSGVAGALIQNGGADSLLTSRLADNPSGQCNINMVLGNSATPAWTGMFNLGNAAGDSLVYDVSGTLTTGGQLTGTLSSYSMRVNGLTFGTGSISSHNIGGRVVGIGDGSAGGVDPTSISGVTGFGIFEHNGGGTMVYSVFGADLTDNVTTVP